MSKKMVIFAWTQKFIIDPDHLLKYNYLKETNFYFGLGDLIRASIKLYTLSKKMNFDLFIDIQLHPISKYLKIQDHPFSKDILKNKNTIDYVCYGAVEDYINSKNNIVYLFTNDFYEGEITFDIQKFIKKLLTPTDEFQNFINEKISLIHTSNYNILHYRLDDSEFLNKKNDHDFIELLNHLNQNKESNDVFITDSKSFKDFVFKKTKVNIFDIKICHLGLSTNDDAIRDTLFEFFLITKACKIKTYCKIHKMSGFVKWISQIYNIPVTTI